jgi:hypothetical protein
MASQAENINARSWLFAPGDSERKMEKATASAADIVLLDLEDAVAEGEKPKARSMVSAFLTANAQHRARLWVRINPLQGPHALGDLAAVVPGCPGGIMLPKARGRADVELVRVRTATRTAAMHSRISWPAAFASSALRPPVCPRSRRFKLISATKRAFASGRQKCGATDTAACWRYIRRRSI